MKIAFLAEAYLTDESTGVDGTQVQLFQLAHAFAERGHAVHYLCATRGKSCDHAVRDNSVTVHYLPEYQGFLAWRLQLSAMRRKLDAISPDALYQRGRSPLTFAAARWARGRQKPFVWGSNGEDSGEHFKFLTRLFRSRRGRLRKLLLIPDMWLRDICVHRGVAAASHIVSQTVHQKNRIERNFGKNAIVLPSYFHVSQAAAAVRRENIALWLANLSAGKQPELFIKIARALESTGGLRFVLAGGSSDRDLQASLTEAAAGLSNLEFAGPIAFADTARQFAHASLYVSTSRPDADGLPNAFIQAWLSGTPVISLNHDPNGWIGGHGLGFCARGDLDLLTAEIRRLGSNDRDLEAMRQRCVQFARETFADPAVIESYLRLFTSSGPDNETRAAQALAA